MTARAYHCRDGIEDDIHVPNLFFKPGSPIAIASSTPSQLTKSVVSQLGQKLVATIPPKYSWPLEFHVVAKKEGDQDLRPAGSGPVFINIGAITATAIEASSPASWQSKSYSLCLSYCYFWQLFLSSP
jgi:hypothetical protein